MPTIPVAPVSGGPADSGAAIGTPAVSFTGGPGQPGEGESREGNNGLETAWTRTLKSFLKQSGSKKSSANGTGDPGSSTPDPATIAALGGMTASVLPVAAATPVGKAPAAPSATADSPADTVAPGTSAPPLSGVANALAPAPPVATAPAHAANLAEKITNLSNTISAARTAQQPPALSLGSTIPAGLLPSMAAPGTAAPKLASPLSAMLMTSAPTADFEASNIFRPSASPDGATPPPMANGAAIAPSAMRNAVAPPASEAEFAGRMATLPTDAPYVQPGIAGDRDQSQAISATLRPRIVNTTLLPAAAPQLAAPPLSPASARAATYEATSQPVAGAMQPAPRAVPLSGFGATPAVPLASSGSPVLAMTPPPQTPDSVSQIFGVSAPAALSLQNQPATTWTVPAAASPTYALNATTHEPASSGAPQAVINPPVFAEPNSEPATQASTIGEAQSAGTQPAAATTPVTPQSVVMPYAATFVPQTTPPAQTGPVAQSAASFIPQATPVSQTTTQATPVADAAGTPITQQTTDVETQPTPTAAKTAPGAEAATQTQPTTPIAPQSTQAAQTTTPVSQQTAQAATQPAPAVTQEQPGAQANATFLPQAAPIAQPVTPNATKAATIAQTAVLGAQQPALFAQTTTPLTQQTAQAETQPAPAASQAQPVAQPNAPFLPQAAPIAQTAVLGAQQPAPFALTTPPLTQQTAQAATQPAPTATQEQPGAQAIPPGAQTTTPYATPAAPTAQSAVLDAQQRTLFAQTTTPLTQQTALAATQPAPTASQAQPGAQANAPFLPQAAPVALTPTQVTSQPASAAALATPVAQPATPNATQAAAVPQTAVPGAAQARPSASQAVPVAAQAIPPGAPQAATIAAAALRPASRVTGPDAIQPAVSTTSAPDTSGNAILQPATEVDQPARFAATAAPGATGGPLPASAGVTLSLPSSSAPVISPIPSALMQSPLGTTLATASTRPAEMVASSLAVAAAPRAAGIVRTPAGGSPQPSSAEATDTGATPQASGADTSLASATGGGVRLAAATQATPGIAHIAAQAARQTRDAVLTPSTAPASPNTAANSGADTLLAGTGMSGLQQDQDPSGQTLSADAIGPASAAPMTQVAQPAISTDPAQAVNSAPREERMAVINQVASHIASIHSGSAVAAPSTVTIHLNPEHWGEMKIAVKFTDDITGSGNRLGAVQAVLTTASPAVRDALLNSRNDLRGALEQSGIKLDKLDVVVGAPNTASMDSGGSSFNGSADSWRGQHLQSASAFSQGSGAGSHSQNAGGGNAQSNGNPSAPRGRSPQHETVAPSRLVEAAASRPSDQLVDYRI
ncbi:MAG: flagellar hook-length control protein FliK [Capsulimonadaceae bacterium]|nr:flagellar hook-length control protein FliK [Capsulimonadaceae bacterium]